MNSRLSEWASIAEILASIAVVVTLIVLIIGVRENTDIVRASAYSSTLQGINEVQGRILSDPDAVRVYTAFINDDIADLSAEDGMRLTLILLSMFRSYESAYYSERYGLLGQEEWRRFDRNICFFFTLASSNDMEDLLLQALTSEFLAYVTGLCSTSEF